MEWFVDSIVTRSDHDEMRAALRLELSTVTAVGRRRSITCVLSGTDESG